MAPLSRADVLEKVTAIVAEQFAVEKGEVNVATHVANELNADSLDAVELVMCLEEEFSNSIPDELLDELETVGRIADYVSSHLKLP